MNTRNQEKPSPILMLAPIAFVLIGYQYLFLSKTNSDLKDRRTQAAKLREQTQDIGREQAGLVSQLRSTKKELAEANDQIQLAKGELSEAESAKADLRAMVLGQVDRNTTEQAATNLTTDEANGNPADLSVSLYGQLASTFTSTVSQQSEADALQDDTVDGGRCQQMDSLCSLLDAHRLRRLENADSPAANSSGLVAAERTELGKLLGTTLPKPARFRLRLEGSFSDLIAALHELSIQLPAVSVLSVSLDPVDVEEQRYIWKLDVGISG